MSVRISEDKRVEFKARTFLAEEPNSDEISTVKQDGLGGKYEDRTIGSP